MDGANRDGAQGAFDLVTLAGSGAASPGLRALAAGLAHDFNNLLAVILSSTEFAELALDAESDEAAALRDARSAALRAADLCKLILAFAGKRSALSTQIDISVALEKTIAALELPAAVKVDFIAPLAPPTCTADPVLIDQLLQALLDNAVAACSVGGGTVVVSVVSEADSIALDIRDNGVGMDAETLARAFEPFFTTHFPNRGLGLAAAQGIARSHEGSIELQSELGIGTLVRVTLPTKVGPKRRRPTTKPIEGVGRRRVLVVDDEPLVARAISRILEAAGYTVRTVHSGSEALARFETTADAYDLVVLDMTMPGIDGAETFRRLRQISSDIRVLLSSGYHHLDSTEALIATGHCWFLAKPYEPTDLLNLVEEILK